MHEGSRSRLMREYFMFSEPHGYIETVQGLESPSWDAIGAGLDAK